jgi:hypothetical protein
MQTQSNLVIIDGCALPPNLYNQARTQAIAAHKVYCVGVLYDAPPKPPQPARIDASELLLSILAPSPFFADLREGNHLRYLMGCTYEELKTCDCAMILCITPYAEDIGGLQ